MTNPLSGFAQHTARWSAARPWRAIGLWLAFVVAAVALASVVSTQDTTNSDGQHGDSGRAAAMLDKANFDDPSSEDVLISPPGGSGHRKLDLVVARQAATAVAAVMERQPGVAKVGAPQVSPDGTAMLISLQLAKDQTDGAPLRAATARVAAQFPQLSVRETGDLTVDDAINSQVSGDLHTAERLSLPLTLILMLLAFGALIAAGLPVLLAATSVAATVGLLAPLSHLIHADSTVTSMIVLIGMAVGVDYSLFYLKREREERAKGRSTLDAVAVAAQTSGHSILVSGSAVIASMAGLFLLTDATFNSLAAGSILVVGVAVVGSLTVLPAMLVKLGRWVDRPRVPLLWRVNRRLFRRLGQGGISRRVLAPVTRHPAIALAGSLAAVLLIAAPGLTMKTHSSNLQTLPTTIPSVQTLRELTTAFPSESPTADLVVEAPAAQQPQVAAALKRLEAAADRTGLFRSAGVEPRVSADRTITELSLPMPFEESSPQVEKAITTLRGSLAPSALRTLPASYAVGGDAAESLDWTTLEHQRLPLVIGFVLLLTLLLMGINFRSVPIAIVSALLNLASVGVAFGAITLVFQDGWFEGALNFSSPGFVIDWLPVFVMSILVGLSMDYHVFVLSRVREYVGRGLPTRLAVERGVADTAGVVTSAAAVMVSVFSIFATLSLMEMKTMGVGLAFAILIDATLIRLVMLPAILCLLGDRAWWPMRRPRPVGQRVPEVEPAYELVQ